MMTNGIDEPNYCSMVLKQCIDVKQEMTMCGLFAYAGENNATSVVVEGLKRLEYRGYDSWGVAVLQADQMQLIKHVGAIGDVEFKDHLPDARVALGHTRWATHGAVNLTNGHPHLSRNGEFSLAHNGIVENYQQLKNDLTAQGESFDTDTDTEVILRLIEVNLLATDDFRQAARQAFLCLQGRNTIMVVVNEEHRVIGIRNGSPLLVGKGKDEYFFASDSLSFADHTDQCLLLDDLTLLDYRDGDLGLYAVADDTELTVDWVEVNHQSTLMAKDGHPHYMLKEILEQTSSIPRAGDISFQELRPLVAAASRARSVFVTGAGGAFFAADQIAYLLRNIGGVHALGIKAYEIASYSCMLHEGDLLIAVSQSGETADTIEAIDYAKAKGLSIACVVNMAGTTITRLSDYTYYNHCGPEICVLSTKSATAQITFGYVLASALRDDRSSGEHKSETEFLAAQMHTGFIDRLVSRTLEVAKKIAKQNHLFILGHEQHFGTALIGALNVKEASYLHAEAFSAGELKHGVIALIEAGVPVIVFVGKEDSYMLNVAAEVNARGAFLIGIAHEDNSLFDEFIELPMAGQGLVNIVSAIIPCQLLAYHLAILRGCDPDRPRNLAKSVTVE